MVTLAVTEGLAVYFRNMRRGSKTEVPRSPPPTGPWRRNTALDNVAVITAFGVVRNFDGGVARPLRVSLTGTTPLYG